MAREDHHADAGTATTKTAGEAAESVGVGGDDAWSRYIEARRVETRARLERLAPAAGEDVDSGRRLRMRGGDRTR